MRYSPIDAAFFVGNRKKTAKKLTGKVFAIVNSADEFFRNGDNYFPYRQNSDFFYLTGIEQEKSILLLCPSHPKQEMREILFIITPNELLATWTGHRLTKEEARKISGMENVMYLEEFEDILNEIVSFSETVYLNEKPHSKLETDHNLPEKYPHLHYEKLTPILTECRLRKEKTEIELISRAAQISEKALQYAITHVKSSAKEYEIEAALMYTFIKEGASACSFMPIVASGNNALTLHYTKNNGICRDGDLVLLDFGCEYANYASDCSVTLPVNGKFNKRQKECYEAVLEVFEKAKKFFVVGNTIEYANQQVNALLETKMIELGLFTQQAVKQQDSKNPLFRKYYMHGVSHFIGLDAHDVGSKNTVFESGMVLSCEPGLYIKEENIGIRIETMLLITDHQPIDLLPNIPRSVAEIDRGVMDKN